MSNIETCFDLYILRKEGGLKCSSHKVMKYWRIRELACKFCRNTWQIAKRVSQLRDFSRSGWQRLFIHWDRVTHICVNKLNHWFRQWLVAGSAPGSYLNQCWFIIYWDLSEHISLNFESQYCNFHSWNVICISYGWFHRSSLSPAIDKL